MTYAACFKHEVYGKVEDPLQICSCDSLLGGKVYPNMKIYKIPDDFRDVTEEVESEDVE